VIVRGGVGWEGRLKWITYIRIIRSGVRAGAGEGCWEVHGKVEGMVESTSDD